MEAQMILGRPNPVSRRRRVPPNAPRTHEGAPAWPDLSIEQQLRRSVMSCLLWQDGFYESGVEIGKRIFELALQCDADVLAEMAVEARHQQNLRHAPLLLLVALCRIGSGTSMPSSTIEKVIGRPDELPELLALYWRMNGRDGSRGKTIAPKRVATQLKLGIAKAFAKFDRYQVAKYQRVNRGVTLADALRISGYVEAKSEAGAIMRELFAGTLKSTDTWEARLGAGENKREVFVSLLNDGKLGYMALLRNLRGMDEAKVPADLIDRAILARKGAQRVLPFRFVSAAMAAPRFWVQLDRALAATVAEIPQFEGKTAVLVDGSGSMGFGYVSKNSEITYQVAASTLAAIVPAEERRIFVFSDRMTEVNQALFPTPLALSNAIQNAVRPGGTMLGRAVEWVYAAWPEMDRLIVITDEQSHDDVEQPRGRGYMINVAANKNGVGYGEWVHVDGWSEATLSWIRELEAL